LAKLVSLAFIGLIVVLPNALLAKDRCLQCHGAHFLEFGSCSSCHMGMKNTTRQELAHTGLVYGKAAYFFNPQSPPIEKGKEMIKKSGCRRCHTIGGKGEHLATSLDASVRIKPFEALKKSLLKPVSFMPNFHFHPVQAEMVLGGILSYGIGEAQAQRAETVHFQKDKQMQDAFSRHCGGCHRLLSKALGPLGEGIVGPNLSGLFGEFYPNDPAIGSMNPEKLPRWIKNPRSIKAKALMPPLDLKEKEMQELIRTLD